MKCILNLTLGFLFCAVGCSHEGKKPPVENSAQDADPFCQPEESFVLSSPNDSLAAIFGEKKKEYVGQLPFRSTDYWHIDSSLNMNGDGHPELFLGDGLHGEYGQEVAVISSCGDSTYKLIYGPGLTNLLFIVKDGFSLPKRLMNLSPGLDSLRLTTIQKQKWPPLLVISYYRQVPEKEGFDPYSTTSLVRYEMQSGKYLAMSQVTCDLSLITDTYICRREGT